MTSSAPTPAPTFRRLVVAGVSLVLVSALGACAGDPTFGSLPVDDRQTGEDSGPRGERGILGDSAAQLIGPLPDGTATSCVEEYSPEAVADRAFAFDGVVVDVGSATSNRGGDSNLDLAGVTFEVGEWFSGGRGSTVTIDMPAPTEGSHGLSEGGPSYAIGSRLLVSGEPRWGGTALSDAIAWSCDFTRYYDPATANSWARALS